MNKINEIGGTTELQKARSVEAVQLKSGNDGDKRKEVKRKKKKKKKDREKSAPVNKIVKPEKLDEKHRKTNSVISLPNVFTATWWWW